MARRFHVGSLLVTLLLVLSALSTSVTASGPILTGNMTATPASVDLTLEGTRDWAHWGLTTAASFDHKAGVAQQISNFTAFGTYWRLAPVGVSYRWTDGTPTLAATTDSGVYVQNVGDYFRLTIPADPVHKTLKIYAGVRGTQAELRAWLSDGSAPVYSNTAMNSLGTFNGVYTLQFAAASTTAKLYVDLRLLTNNNSVSNPSVSLQSASLF